MWRTLLTKRGIQLGLYLASQGVAWGNPGHEVTVAELSAQIAQSPKVPELYFQRAWNYREMARLADARTDWVSGQNYLYADVKGNIGQLMAVRLPKRAPDALSELIRSPEDVTREWNDQMDSADLPKVLNPPDGFIASANNRPAEVGFPVAAIFSPNDRIERLKERLAAAPRMDLAYLKALQRDVDSPKAKTLALKLADILEYLPIHKECEDLLRNWCGSFAHDSLAAVAYSKTLYAVSVAYYLPQLGKELTEALLASELFADIFDADLAALDIPARRKLADAAAAALVPLEGDVHAQGPWGKFHAVSVEHYFAAVPLIGHRFKFLKLPAAGSSATINKSAAAVSDKPHLVNYGQQARHLSDLAQPDENYFLLLGGQDGWLASENTDDQARMWNGGELIRVPLTSAGGVDFVKERIILLPKEMSAG